MARRRIVRRKRARRRYMTRRGGNTVYRLRKPFPRGFRTGIHFFKRTLSLGAENGGATGVVNFAQGAGSNGASIIWSADTGVTFCKIAAASTVGAPSYVSFAFAPSLANIPNLTEFTNLFDAYQIRKVIVKFQPYANVSVSDQGATGPDASWIMHYVIDHDSAVLPAAGQTGLLDLYQYNNYKQVKMLSTSRKPVTWVLKPRTNKYAQSASGVATATVEGKRNEWIDCANVNIAHYGIRGIMEAVNPSAADSFMAMRAEVTYYLKFKGPR